MTAEHKRTAALGLIGECTASLRTVSDAAAVREVVMNLASRAHTLQGGARDLPYFTRTMSQLAHVVRSYGWVEVASDTLEWGITRGALDGHVLSEVAECQLARGDVRAAEATLERAKAAGVSTDAIYTSLVKAYGRSGQPERARLLFEQAQADAAVTSFTYPALIAAYASAGDLGNARRTFDRAGAAGHLSPPAFTALATAYATAADTRGIDGVLALAREAGQMSSRLALTAIRARLSGRQFAAARRLLEDAKREGMADVPCYVAVVVACQRAGRHREAKRVYTSATTDPRLGIEDLRRVKLAHHRTRKAAAPGSPEETPAALRHQEPRVKALLASA